jgi:hypothetical protein
MPVGGYMKIILVSFTILFVGCATSKIKTEHAHYLEIKSYVASQKPGLATNEIFIFEKNYPNSDYLCELWNIQIAFGNRVGFSEKFLKETEEKRKTKCSTLKKE